MVFARGVDINHNGEGRTDNRGAFSLEGLEPGTYRIELRKWDTGLSYDETVELTGNRDIILRVPTARIIGHVRDSIDKEPLPGVRIDLESADGTTSDYLPAYAAVTDLNGRFEIANIPDGSWVLDCNKKGYAAGTLDVQIINGRDRSDLRIDLDPTEGLILQVRHSSGTIPDSVQVAVLDPTGRAVTNGNFSTGENGSVRLSSVPPGEWELLLGAAGAGYSRIRANAPGGPVAVTLPPACALRIEVPELAGSGMIATASLVDSNGRPFVSLGWMGTPMGEIHLAGGRAEISALPPDTWNVRVMASDGRAWEGSATTTPGVAGTVVLE